MSQLQVRLKDERNAFRPGDELRGVARWHLDAAARKIELRLCWFTRGVGIPEAHVMATESINHPDLDSSRSFAFRLPEAPLSYIGTLSSLFWAVELVVLPSQECARAVFSLSHTGGPLPLIPVEEDEEGE